MSAAFGAGDLMSTAADGGAHPATIRLEEIMNKTISIEEIMGSTPVHVRGSLLVHRNADILSR